MGRVCCLLIGSHLDGGGFLNVRIDSSGAVGEWG